MHCVGVIHRERHSANYALLRRMGKYGEDLSRKWTCSEKRSQSADGVEARLRQEKKQRERDNI